MAQPSATRPVLLCFDGSEVARLAVERSASLVSPGPALVAHAWLPLYRVLLRSPVFPSPGPLAGAAADMDAGRT